MEYDTYQKYRAKLSLIENSPLRIQATYLLEFIQRAEAALDIEKNILQPNQRAELSPVFCLDSQGINETRRLVANASLKLNNILDTIKK